MAVSTNDLQGNNRRSFSMAKGSVLPGTGHQEVVQWAEGQLTKARKARLQFEQVWFYNLAFYFGRQYVQWTPNYPTPNGSNYARLYEPPAPPWRVRLVSNKIKPIIRSEHSKLTKENPEPYVVPRSTDDDDLAAARAGQHIFEFLWDDLKCKRTIRRMAFWLSLTGNGFIKDWFDPSQADSSGLPGAMRVENVTPFHFFVPDLDEEEIEHQPYVFHVMAKDVEWAEEKFGKPLVADTNAGGQALEQKFLQALGINQPEAIEEVAIKEMHVKPCKKFKDGAVITWANDQMLNLFEGSPYDHNEYPFTHFSHIPTGRFYGDSVIQDLIPIQKEYNRTRSQIIEAKNKMAKPQLLAARGSIDPNKITSEPGLIVFYTPGFTPPTPLKLEPLPNYVIEELGRCQQDMDDVSGQHEVSKGHAPPGVTAATAISYLQEEDDSKLANSISSIEEGVEKIGKHLLEHVQQFWDLPRTVRVVGTDGEYESYILSSADIAGNTDLKIEAGSAMPRSRAAKQAYIMQLGQMGWIPPDRALRYLDMAETGRLYEELQIDARQAQRENLKMLNGVQVAVNTWDEHAVHVLEHNNERKKQRFENANPQIQAAFEQHVKMHQMVMQQNAVQAAMTQQQTGMPPQATAPAHPVTRPVQMPAINPLQSGSPQG